MDINKNNPNNNRQGLGIVLITTLLVAFVLIGFFSAMGNTSQREISYDKFLKLVSEHKVKEVKLDSEKIYITLTDKAREEAREKAVEKAEKEGRSYDDFAVSRKAEYGVYCCGGVRYVSDHGCDGASHYQCGTREKYGKRMV